MYVNVVVRSKVAFACLSALAPLALSLLPTLQKAAKMVFPQVPAMMNFACKRSKKKSRHDTFHWVSIDSFF